MSFQADLQHAFNLCSQTNTQQIKKGEYILQALKKNDNYPILLFQYIKESPSFNGKLRATIEIRLWCEMYKGLQAFQQQRFSHVIDDVKINIVMAYLSLPDKLSQTLLIGIVALSVIEFPDNWGSLLPGLMAYSQDHPQSTLRILELLVEISNKYSYMSRSDPLYKQIIIFCEKIHDYLLKLTRISMNTLMNNQGQMMNIKILENLMILFYNMNYQDLPPQFQDNLAEWMNILNQVMQLPNTNEGFFKCKGAALQSILLYASKYKEDVQQSIKGFSEQIWSLCANAKPDPDYDDIVFNALKYFRSLILWQDMKDFFANSMPALISNLIIPNITINKDVIYLLEDDTQNFINNYFRNGEIGTRRASALDLLKTITRNFKAFQIFIQEQISGFDTSSQNVSGECMLLTLVTDSAPKAFRDIDGATQLYLDPKIIQYCYQTFVKNTLTQIFNIASSNNLIENQMDKVHLIVTLRFLFYFRAFLPFEELPSILKLCCMINTNDPALRQISLLMISSYVSIRHGDYMLLKEQKNFFDENNFGDVAKQVFNVIINCNKQSAQLNGSLTKLFHISIKHLKTACHDFYEYSISPVYKSFLDKINNYDFNTALSLFQGISHLAYYLCLNKSNHCFDLENFMQNFFMKMIQKQSDLLNFCFQVLSIFLQMNPGNIEYYQNIYTSILSPDNWREQNLSIMASYIQYISAFITASNNKIIDNKNQFETILSKLIELEHFDLFYRFLKKILKITGIEGFVGSGYMDITVQGTNFIFQKGIEGRKTGLYFFFELIFNYNSQYVINSMNASIPGFFEQSVIDNQQIIKTIQIFRFRKTMYGALCNSLVSGCFNNPQSYAIILNLLIENALGRIRNSYMPNTKQNKDSTYQKLQIFKEIQIQDSPVNLDEEDALLKSYSICLDRDPGLINQIKQQNQVRMKKLNQRQNHNR